MVYDDMAEYESGKYRGSADPFRSRFCRCQNDCIRQKAGEIQLRKPLRQLSHERIMPQQKRTEAKTTVKKRIRGVQDYSQNRRDVLWNV